MRITGIMQNTSTVRTLNRHQYEMDKIQNQLATGQKIQTPKDNPAAATNQMFFRTRVNELDQFDRNINDGMARLNIMDGELGRITDIMQRIRVLTVQASNGVYQGDNGFELKNAIASEIDQHLRALIDIGNGKDATGLPLFGGFTVERAPFEPIVSNIKGLKGLELENQIIGVEYRGDIGKRLLEVERSQYIDVNLPGNQALWGTNFTVTGSVDNSGYIATSDQAFRIDGVEMRVQAGDTIDDIIDKINHAGIDVKASKIGQDYISLHSTSPHQIWLEDMEGGTVLKDIGLVSADRSRPPNNYADTARVAGLSLFDTIIKLRNDLMAGDQLEISGRDLGNLDEALDNVLRHRSQIGARQNRLEEHTKRVAWDKNYMTELLANNEGIDPAETIMNLKWLESVHGYALNVGARIIKPTLMDFLR
ncbi:MAG: flagellar hook-associated protein 3 [Leptonema sp. (in: Bacteria)]|nr:flagellar hook-associated protein 3 [Leptonema sp. (in: bacteria)]